MYWVAGKKKESEQAFLRALDLQPGLLSSYQYLAALYADDKNYDRAVARLEQVAKLAPKDITTHMLRGAVAYQRGDRKRAQEAYETVLTIEPRFGPAANNLALLLSEQDGDRERALQLAQLAKEVSPEDPSVSDTLGWILSKRGVHQRGLALLQESASKLPGNPTVQYHLGATYARVGDRDRARKALAAAVASKVDFPEREAAKRALVELQ